jgi:hypothetical protein
MMRRVSVLALCAGLSGCLDTQDLAVGRFEPRARSEGEVDADINGGNPLELVQDASARSDDDDDSHDAGAPEQVVESVDAATTFATLDAASLEAGALDAASDADADAGMLDAGRDAALSDASRADAATDAATDATDEDADASRISALCMREPWHCL